MSPSPNVTVRIELSRVRENARAVKARVGDRVAVFAVVKADAYGLGATEVAGAVRDLVDGFCVFRLSEAQQAGLAEIAHKPTLSLGPPESGDPEVYRAANVWPAVATADQARQLRAARPALCVDTGMQRFACPPDRVQELLSAGACSLAFTHGTRVEHALKLKALLGGRGIPLQAAGTALLDEPAAWLDGVRPGLALYRGAARVSSPLVEVRDGAGPAGYSGFVAPRFGVILCGYSNGLRAGVCVVNGQRRRVLEVGMQSAFIECATEDRAGDEAVLLGDGLTEQDVAAAWETSPQTVLVHLSAAGQRVYSE